MLKSRINISRIIGITCVAIVLGLLYGIAISASNIINNNYLDQKLYNLSLFDIQSNTTTYSLSFIFLLLLAYLCFKIINKLSESKFFVLKSTNSKQFSALPFLIKISLLCAVLYLFFYSEILQFFKILAINGWFKNFIQSPVDTYKILVLVFILSTFLFLVLITLIFSKLNLIEPTVGKLTKLVDSKQIRLTGIAIFTLLILFNLSIWAYKGINKPDTPNILLITIDTLRSDRLGSYGYTRDTTPNIDRLAKHGILFENAYSQSSWTYPSMASMHTSLYPTQIGVNRFENRINDKVLTLSEYMQNNFYKTFAVVSNIVVSKIFGFNQGFDKFEETYSPKADEPTSKVTTERAKKFIKSNKDKSFLLWVHYMDPHSLYLNHDEFDYVQDYDGLIASSHKNKDLNKIKGMLNEDDLAYINDLYDEEISYTDKYIGELIDSLSEFEIDDNTIIIITADHGEEFLERSHFGHGHTLYQEVIKVPLIVYNPIDRKLSGNRVSDNVEVRYIAKTILELINLKNDNFKGDSLIEIADKGKSHSIAYSEIGKAKNAIFIADWKLISNLKENSQELYNLEQDPNEIVNEDSSNEHDVIQVKDMLETKLSDYKNFKQEKTNKLVLEEEDINKLRALGYMQ